MCTWCVRSKLADRLTAGVSPSRRRFLAYTASLAVMAGTGLGAKATGSSSADTIIHNGPVYPMSAPGAKAEALAVAGGKIIAVGSEAEVMALKGPATQVVDLAGRTLLPGLIDPHNHMTLTALFDMLLTDVGFSKYKTKADVITAMKAAAAKTAPGAWLAFSFYDNLLQGGDFSMADLDSVSTTHPIYLLYVNGHVGCGNTLAFERAGVTAATGVMPGGGYFGHDSEGKLTGLIYNEPALLKFLDLAVKKPTPADLAKAIESYAQQSAAAGLTALHEPGTVKPEWVEMLAKLSTTLPIRYSASFNTELMDAGKPFVALGPSDKARILPGTRFSLYGLKYLSDGSNQAESAAQTKPYLGTDSRGRLSYTTQQATDICAKAKEAGWTIQVHCQGDAAVDQVLDAIEASYGANPATGLNRVEHATMARADQIERMKKLGCEPTFMIDFVYLYGADYRDHIFGPERAEFMVPVGAAAKAGIGYSLHTDNPAAGLPVNPLRLVETAVTRRCMVDSSVVGDDIALKVEEALRGITQHAARHLGMGDMIGTLESGKEADLTILAADPHTVAPEQISAIKVSETWLAGEKKFG
jgi:predicted amidohydrolase YtcJ